MKGQISIEFISLLSIALLASSILVTAINDKALEYSQSSPYTEAQSISQKVAYKVDYVLSERNTTLNLTFSPRLDENYNISIASGQVITRFDSGSSSYPTRYTGSEISLNSSQSYQISYGGGLVVG